MNGTKKDNLKQILPYEIIRLNFACNANCLFCNVPYEQYYLQKMSLQGAKEQIDRLILKNKAVRLDFSGGEPTIRNDLPRLIKYASKKEINVIQVQTNGIVLSDVNYVNKLKKACLNKLFIGLHSHIPRIHDYLVGLRGAFKKCIIGIKNSLKSNIEVILNPVITSKNYEELPDYIKFVKDNFPQIRSISLSVVQPRGRALSNYFLLPRYGTISPYVRKSLSLAKKFNLVVNNPYCGLPLCIGGWYKYLEQCMEYCVNRLRLEANLATVQLYLQKIKGHSCSFCDLSNFCNGVWKEYAAIYSFSDLKPIKLEKNRK